MTFIINRIDKDGTIIRESDSILIEQSFRLENGIRLSIFSGPVHLTQQEWKDFKRIGDEIFDKRNND